MNSAGHGDVGADVGTEPLEQRPIVVAQRADVELHDEAVFDAHPGELDQHVASEAARLSLRGPPRKARARMASAPAASSGIA